jgi:hypothetical protein
LRRNFVATYRPICGTRAGRAAIARYGLPPFIDGSCRREPDLQLPFPAITALCRAGNFAPRLQVGSYIAYITKRGAYGSRQRHWRLTALLEVAHRFESHREAAAWYLERGSRVPHNCVVQGNRPAPFDATDGTLSRLVRDATAGRSPEHIIRVWDHSYHLRAQAHPVVLACQPIAIELHDPPVINESDWLAWHGRVPPTLNPPAIPDTLWQALLARATGPAAA